MTNDLDMKSAIIQQMEAPAPRRHEQCYIDIFQPIPERTKALVSFGGTDAIFRSDITVVSGGEGTGKSSLLRIIMAACIGDREVLGVTAESGLRIQVHDTEQDLSDILPEIADTFRLAGIPRTESAELKDRLIFTTTRREEREAVEGIFTDIVTDNKADIVILDGIGDLIADVNDMADATRLVANMLKIVDEQNIALICILHTNPNDPGGKLRGNLGSELMRKAKCSILLTYEESNGSFKVSCKKSRRKKFSPFYFAKDEFGQIIQAEAPATNAKPNNTKDRIYAAMEPGKTYNYEILYKMFPDVDTSTVRRNVGELVKEDRITAPARGQFVIKLSGENCVCSGALI